MSEVPNPSSTDVTFYHVEKSANGQPECQCENCVMWTIAYNDGTEDCEISTSWQGEAGREQAGDICDWMNSSYNAGIEAAQAAPAYDCRSAIECKRILTGNHYVPPPGWVYAPDLQRDADRYRFLRKSESELGPKEEDAFAAVWRELSGKGSSSRFDWIVDDGRQRCAEAAALDEENNDVG